MFRLLSSAVEAVLGGEDDHFDFTTAEDLVEELKAGDESVRGATRPYQVFREALVDCADDKSAPTPIAVPSVLQFLQSELERGSHVSGTVTEEEAMLDFDTPAEEADDPRPEPDALYYAVFHGGALDHVYGHLTGSETTKCARLHYPDTSIKTSTRQENEATLQRAMVNPFRSLKDILREVGPPEDGQSVAFEDLVDDTVAVVSAGGIRDAFPPLGKSALPEVEKEPLSPEISKPASEDSAKGGKRPRGHLRTVSAPEPTKQPKSKKGKKKTTPQQKKKVTSQRTASVQHVVLADLPIQEETFSMADTVSSSPTLVASISPSLSSSTSLTIPSSPSNFEGPTTPEIGPSHSPALKSRCWSWLFGPSSLTSDDTCAGNGILEPAKLTGQETAGLPALLWPATLTDGDADEDSNWSMSVLGPSSLTERPMKQRALSMLAGAQTASDNKLELKWTTEPGDLGIAKKATTTVVAAKKKTSPLPLTRSAAAAVQLSKWVPETEAASAPSAHGPVKPTPRLLPDSKCSSDSSDAQKLNMSKHQRKRYNRRLRREKEAALIDVGKAFNHQAVVMVETVTEEAVKIATIEPTTQGLVHEITEKAMQNIPLHMRLSLATLPFKVCIKSTIEAYSYASMVYAPPIGPLQQEFGPQHLVMWTDGSQPVRYPQTNWRLQAFAVVYRNNPIAPGQEASGWEEWAYTANVEGQAINTLEATAVHMALGIAIDEVDRRANTPNPITKLTIFTDSQHTLCSLLIKNMGVLGTSMVRYGDLLASRGVTTDLRWVPSHAAVPGNEAADRLAKLASHFGPVPKEGALIRVPVPLLRMCQKQLGLAEVFSRGENPDVLKPFLRAQKQGLREALERTCLKEGWGEMMAET